MIPHLLFAIHYLELGGAERSLIGLLRALDYSKVQVDLFVYSHRGELMKEIPQEVVNDIKEKGTEAFTNGRAAVLKGLDKVEGALKEKKAKAAAKSKKKTEE